MKKTLFLFAIFVFVFTLSFAARGPGQGFELPEDYGSKFQKNVKGDRSADFTITLIDSYGDGWNGGMLDVLVNGTVVLDDITIVSGAGPEDYTFAVNQDDSVFVDYTAGSYPSENEYYVYNNIGTELISSGVGYSTPTDNYFIAAPIVVTSIYDIQYTTDPSGDSPYLGQVVTTTGIITASEDATKGSKYFIQDGSGAWNGVYLYDYNHSYDVGQQVLITCEVDEYYNKTELKTVTDVDTLASGVALPAPAELTTNEVNQEDYEGVLVSVQNATCTADTNSYGEWEIDDGSGPVVVDDVFYAFDPVLDGTYFVTGPVDYSYDAYKILPRNAGDIIVPLTEFTEGFETWVPENWILESPTGDNWVQDDGTAYGPGSAYAGTYAAMYNNYSISSDDYGFMITPPLDLVSLYAAKLSFYWWNDGSSYTPATITILTSNDGGISYTAIDTIEAYGSGATTWIYYEQQIGTDVQFVKIKGTSDFGYDNTFIDEFSISEIPPVPVMVLSDSTHDFGMVDQGDVQTWDFDITNDGAATLLINSVDVNAPFSCTYPDSVVAGATATATVELDASTRGVYDEMLTLHTNAAQDSTIDLSAIVQGSEYVMQGFEDIEFPPFGWTNPGRWRRYTDNAYAGDGYARVSWYHDSDANLITPRLVIEGDDFINFWWRNANMYNNKKGAKVVGADTLYVEISNTYNNAQPVWEVLAALSPEEEMPEYENVTLLIPDTYIGNNAKIRFRHRSELNAESRGVGLDNVILPAVYTPVNFELDPYTQSGYNAIGNTVEYEINVHNIGVQSDRYFISLDEENSKTSRDILIDESFEGDTFPPDGWSEVIYGDQGWIQDYYGSGTYGEPNGTGEYFANCDSDAPGSGVYVYAGLFTPALNLAGKSTTTLDLVYNIQIISSEYAQINVYSGGTSEANFEENLWEETEDDEGSLSLEFDPSGYSDPSQVYIEFLYDDDNVWGWNFAIDDVVIEGSSGPGPGPETWPVTLSDTYIDVAPGETGTFTATVEIPDDGSVMQGDEHTSSLYVESREDYLINREADIVTTAHPRDPYEPNNVIATASAWVYGDSTEGAQIYYNSDYSTKDIDIYEFTGDAGDIIQCSFLLPADETAFDGAINLVDADSISYAFADAYAGGGSEVLNYRLLESGTYYLVLGKWNLLKEEPYKKNVSEGSDKTFYTMKLDHIPSPDVAVFPDSINLGFISSKDVATDVFEITNTGADGADDLAFNIDFDIPGYTELMNETFEHFPPDGWTTEGGSNWMGSNSSNAGGTAPEAEFYWSPSTTGLQRLISSELNTTGLTTLPLTFKHYVNDYSGGYTIGVATTSDGGTTWNDVWTSSPTGDMGPETIAVDINNADVGSEDFQLCFYFDGTSFNINYWYVDDVNIASGNKWVEADPVSGNVPQGTTFDVDVSADPAELDDGAYKATLNLHNNALLNGASDIEVPVYFYIGEEAGGLEGYVTFAGTGEPIEGVHVTAGNFEAYTDADGYYNFDPIALGTYDVVFEKDGFQTDIVYGVPLHPMYTVNLDRALQFDGPPPRNLVAEGLNEYIHLDWDKPDTGGGGGGQVDYILDDGTFENGWAINPGYESWLGNLFPVTDAGEIISFEVYGDANASAGSETVTIDIYDSDQNLVGTSDAFQIPADDWTTVSVPNVAFDGEFYAMVHWNMLTSATNYVGFDEDGPNATANYDWYYDGSSWQLLHVAAGGSPGVLGIRATAEVNGQTVTYAYNQKKLGKEPDVNLKSIDASKMANNSSKVNSDVLSQSGNSVDTGNYETSHYYNLHMKENTRASKDFTILGYNVYEESKGFVGYVDGENTTDYDDDIVEVGTEYTYWTTAVYDAGEGGESNTASAIPYISGGWGDDFSEDWASTGLWSLDPASPNNWEYDATNQCAMLNWSPSTTNYDMSLVSEEFTLPSDPAEVFDFTASMYVDDYSTDSGEMMEIWIIHGGDETMIWQWDLDANDDWGVSGGQTLTYTDTDQFAGETVQIKFRSHGGDTFNFNYWYVYNVLFDYQGVPPAYGALDGIVTDGDGNPIEGAAVDANLARYNTVYTNADGEYEIDPMKVGTFDIVYSADGYTTITEEDVVIEEGVTTTLDVVLGQPTMDVDPLTINTEVGPSDTTIVPITITNDGDAPLYWEGSTFTVEKGFDPSAYPTYPEVTAGMKLKTRDDDHSCGLASQPAPNDPFGLTVDMPPRDEFGYGDVAYDPGSTIPTGPCYFDLTNPADVTNLGPAASDFIAAADYADGTWYGIVYGGTFITIDMDTGNITTIGSTCDASGMGYDWTTGTMYAVDFDGNLYTIDLDTGAQTTVATTQPSLITMACSNDGTLYGFDLTNDVLGTIDKDTGTWTQIGSVGIDMNYAQDASFDHATNTLYWAAYDATTGGQLMTVDTDTGMASLIGAFPNALEMTGFTIPASADTWLSIDPTEGTIEPGTSGTVDAYLAGCDDPIGTVKEGGIEFTSPQGVPSVTVDVTLLIAPPTSGTLEGTVTDTDTNPINGAIVTAGTYQATTDASGGYTIEDIATGDYDVVASHTSYNTSDPASVTILEDQTTTQDFALTQPTMDVTPTTIEEYVAPDDPISVDVSVANNGDGPLNYTVDLIRGVETDYSNCTSGTLEKSDGTTSGGNSNGFVAEENAKDDVTIHYDGPNDDAIGLTDGGTFMVAARFTSDELGDYYGDYQLSNVELYIQDIPTNVTLKVWEGGSMGDPGTEIYSEDVTSQITDPETWTTIALTAPIDLVSDNEYWVGYEVTHDVGLYPAGCDAGPAVSGKGDWIYLDPGPWDEIANSGYSVNWNIRAVLSPGVIPWITYSPNSGYVEAGNTGTVTVDFNTVDHDVGEVLTAQLQFNSDPDVGSQNVDIQVTVGDQEATGQTEVTETALNASFPNPFTDHTTISFSLKQASNVKLSIYNVKGQLVETLVNDNMDTGIHEIEWNADSGRVGSGIYFYKLETENKSFLKKMIMMK